MSQPRARFNLLAHLLPVSVTEVNSQIVDEVFLDMRFEGRDWTFAVPRLTPTCCRHLGIMVRGGLAGRSAECG